MLGPHRTCADVSSCWLGFKAGGRTWGLKPVESHPIADACDVPVMTRRRLAVDW